jgi:hypothetical protein
MSDQGELMQIGKKSSIALGKAKRNQNQYANECEKRDIKYADTMHSAATCRGAPHSSSVEQEEERALQ